MRNLHSSMEAAFIDRKRSSTEAAFYLCGCNHPRMRYFNYKERLSMYGGGLLPVRKQSSTEVALPFFLPMRKRSSMEAAFYL